MPFNLFGKKEKPTDPQEAINKLKESEEMLEKKSKHLEDQIGKELTTAKQAGTKNKRVALNALKRKKRLEQQLTQIDNTLTTIEFQREALQNARSNAEILKTMQTASKAMKTVHKEVNIDSVEDVMEDIQEQQDIAAEISDAISRPIAMPGMEGLDDDDLMAELEELEQEQLDEQLLDTGAQSNNTQLPEIPNTSLPAFTPAQPSAARTQEEDDLADLENWVAS